MGSEMRTAAFQVVQKLQDEGYQAVFAGGCVRDQLLGLTPKDYDVATSATPHEVIQFFPNAVTVGAHFGVVLVKVQGCAIEIATFRTDGSYADGRKPESVTFDTIDEDASRRDFTINGLFYDPITDKLLDFVGGQKDLEVRTLRAIGNAQERFAEDHLRLLRAVRFATRFEFEIAEETWEALEAFAPDISRISPERIRDELDRIWVHPNRVLGFDLLVKSGLMLAIFPEILKLQGCEQPPQWHPEGDVFVHTRIMLDMLPDEASLPLVLSVLFHDIGKPVTYSFDKLNDRIRFNGGTQLWKSLLIKMIRRPCPGRVR